jgi:hypothetical protein
LICIEFDLPNINTVKTIGNHQVVIIGDNYTTDRSLMTSHSGSNLLLKFELVFFIFVSHVVFVSENLVGTRH